MKHAIPVMLERGGGAIINTASAFAHVGSTRHSGYPASKAGVLLLTVSTAGAFAKQNIRVNSVSPGHIETPLMSRNRPIQEVRDAMAKRIPQGRMGTPAEVANVVLFLASDEASHVTGTTYKVDGGYINVGT
jgi:NAD(P)-dependent dehydrogenase (short-subunit alcohol dehydrogenase family)